MFVWPKILFLLILYDAEEMTNALFPLKNTYTHKKEVEKR